MPLKRKLLTTNIILIYLLVYFLHLRRLMIFMENDFFLFLIFIIKQERNRPILAKLLKL